MSKTIKNKRRGQNPTPETIKLRNAVGELHGQLGKITKIKDLLEKSAGDCLEDLHKRVSRIEKHLNLGEMDEQSSEQKDDSEVEAG